MVSMPIGEEMLAEVQLSPNRRKRKLGHQRPSRIASFQTKKQLPISPANSYQDPAGTDPEMPLPLESLSYLTP